MRYNWRFREIICLIISSASLLSCEKEESKSSVNQVNITEDFIIEFTNSLIKSSMTHYCFENSITLSEKYTGSIEYRIAQGVQIGNHYFYSVQSRFNEKFLSQTGVEQSWDQIGQWEDKLLYRYSFSEKKAYLYSMTDDPSPKVLFDFNVSIGDTVDLGSHISNFSYPVIITAENSININNHQFPNFEARPINSLNTFIQLSPDLPNPFAFDNTGPFHELDTLVSIPPCTQTGGVTYSRGGFSYEGNWVYYL